MSDWHVSSGIGDSYRADSVLVKDRDGLPYIPGRAVKGALREGAHRLTEARPDLKAAEDAFWGTRNNSAESNRTGILHVSSARLPRDLREAFAAAPDSEKPSLVRDLTIVRRQTALDERGNTIDHSLRSLECGIAGLTFKADLDIDGGDIPEKWIIAYMTCVCAAVRSIGGSRSRGLGACRVCLDGIDAAPVLPGRFQGA